MTPEGNPRTADVVQPRGGLRPDPGLGRIEGVSKPQGASGIALALNLLAALWVLGGLASVSTLWPNDGPYGRPTQAEIAPALTVAFIAGLAATVAVSAAAIVKHLARRDGPSDS
jgi:hypothetical protein